MTWDRLLIGCFTHDSLKTWFSNQAMFLFFVSEWRRRETANVLNRFVSCFLFFESRLRRPWHSNEEQMISGCPIDGAISVRVDGEFGSYRLFVYITTLLLWDSFWILVLHCGLSILLVLLESHSWYSTVRLLKGLIADPVDNYNFNHSSITYQLYIQYFCTFKTFYLIEL